MKVSIAYKWEECDDAVTKYLWKYSIILWGTICPLLAIEKKLYLEKHKNWKVQNEK